MSLKDLIYKNRKSEFATATPATSATHGIENEPTVASVATVAVANIRNTESRCDNCSNCSNSSCSKPEKDKSPSPDPYGCAGALISSDGGLYLPWGPYLNRAKLKEWQRELFDAVDEVARMERWSRDHYDTVIGAIDRQPISTLRPDLAHFRKRLQRARRAAGGEKP